MTNEQSFCPSLSSRVYALSNEAFYPFPCDYKGSKAMRPARVRNLCRAPLCQQDTKIKPIGSIHWPAVCFRRNATGRLEAAF